MATNSSEDRDSAVVLLFDPKDLADVQLDRIRSSGLFETMMTANQVPAIFLASEQKAIKATLQPTRLEFTEEHRTPFSERTRKELAELLSLLPELDVKSFGLNYTLHIKIEASTAGTYIKNRFYKESVGLESFFDGPVLSGSSRLIFGDTSDYCDLRLTPLDLQSNTAVLQYHYHKDEHVKDRSRLVRLIETKSQTEIERLHKLIPQL